MHRRSRILLLVLAIPLGLIFAAILMVTQTDWGRERVRRFAVSALEDMVIGEVRIGAVEGNLLRGVILRNVSIVDSLGRPFVAAEAISARFGRRALLGRRIELWNVRLERPVIVLDRQPSEDLWNFQQIFRVDEPEPERVPELGWGSWVRLRDVRIDSGRVVIRMPWEPGTYDTEAARQRAIDNALAGEGRERVVSVPGGFQQVLDFRALFADLAEVVVADPEKQAMTVEVASLRTIAEPFLPPAADIRDLRGTFRLTDDSLSFQGIQLELPRTAVVGSGHYLTENGDLWLRLSGERVALNDMRWIYPRLPSEGGGPLDLTVGMLAGVLEVGAETPGLRIHDARLSGRLGFMMADDSVRFRDTDLRFAAVDTRLVEQLVPDFTAPRHGTLHGRAALDGHLSAMRVDADITFDDRTAGRSRMLAAGEAGMANGALRARELLLRFEPVQVELARQAMPDLPVSGTVTGQAVLTGSTASRMVATVELVHLDRGARSAVSGRGGVELVAPQRLDIDLRVHPLSLVTVGRFVPAIELNGAATGTIRVTGNMGDAAVALDLGLPGGGALEGRGRLALDGPAPGYDFNAALRVVDVARIVQGAPTTTINATLAGRGIGIDPETMRATFAVVADRSVFDGVILEEAEGRLVFEDGLLTLDTLHVATDFARAEATGTFGIASSQEGELRYEIAVDSLAGFSRWMPPVDTGFIEPAPRARARAVAQARRELARLTEAAEVERVALGEAHRRAVEVEVGERAIARDTLSGSVLARGTATGSVDRFDVRGDATAYELIVAGNALGFGRVEYAVSSAPTADMRFVVGATLDSVRAAGFAFDTVQIRGVMRDRAGDIHLAIIQEADVEYVMQAEFELRPEENSIRLSDLRMRFDTTVWMSARPAAIRWGPAGISVDSLDLRSGPDGRLYVNGVLPTDDDIDLEVDVHRFELGHAVALFQREEGARGIITMTARATGTPASPNIRGAAGLVAGELRDRGIPDVRAAFTYSDQKLVANAQAHGGQRQLLAVAEATIPVNLALTADAGQRMLDEPMAVDIHADGLPLDALPSLTDAVADVQGQLTGDMTIRGTISEPEVNGDLVLDLASFLIVAIGVRLTDIGGAIQIRGDTMVIDSLVGWSRGRMRLEGGLGLATLAEPSFDLRLRADNAILYNTETGQLRGDADLRMTGPWDGAFVTGDLTIRSGVYYLEDAPDAGVIDLADPQLLREVDLLLLAEEAEALPDPFPLIDNLRAELNVRVMRDTWIRSPEANVEIFSVGDLELELDMARDVLALEGVVNTDRGEYTFLGRRFLVTRGSVTFIGGEEINPLLQIVAEHEVRGRDPFEIQVVIAGTMRDPQVTLESNAQPPISQSDLLQYIAFGRQAGSLLQLQGATGLAETGRLTGGRVIGLATQQMAAVALGVLVSELERTAGRTLGAEVINITPGDVPQELARGAPYREILRGTEVEVGRYVDARTFVAVQSRLHGGNPGIRVQHRLPGGYRVETALEPRFQVRPPTLAAPPEAQAFNVFSFFLIREWRF